MNSHALNSSRSQDRGTNLTYILNDVMSMYPDGLAGEQVGPSRGSRLPGNV